MAYAMKKLKTLDERFWPKVEKLDDTSCWLWQGATSGHPVLKHYRYGHIHHSWIDETGVKHASDYNACAVSYFLHFGLWPEANLLHSCDTVLCVNPRHLTEGTQKQNMEQRDARGRNGTAGSTHRSKGVLPIRKRLEIIALKQLGLSISQLANFYGAHWDTIKKIQCDTIVV